MIKYETNSRLIKEGQIFVAIKGHTVDAHEFIPEAIKNGATKVIVEHAVDYDIPQEIVTDTKEFLKESLVSEYSHEFDNINFIGVTGTNGKTTTCYLAYQMLQKLGTNVAYLGTIGFYHKDEFVELANTTPDILILYKLLLDAKEKGATHIIMEVSSHALELDRIAGLKYKVGAFTNLTQDHLDFHGTMEEYLKSKLKLVSHLKEDGVMILNNDDEASNEFAEIASHLTIGLSADYNIDDYTIKPDATNIDFTFDSKKYNVRTNLTSRFNVYNYLTALAIVNQIGFSIEDIINCTPEIYPPKGRCETIKVGRGYAVVDYAHTPDAVEKVIGAYSELKENRIITIVGCGGDRDPKKRPIMGKIATDNSDLVIFTNDNPRTEEPEAIMKDILAGNDASNYEVILDRKEAIIKGIEILEENDILLILGKGHEDYQIIGREKIHFDDAEIVKGYQK